MEYTRDEIMMQIDNLKLKIEALNQELIKSPEYEDDILSDMAMAELDIDVLQQMLDEDATRDFEAEQRQQMREWEDTRI